MEVVKGKVTWIDILKPTKTDVEQLRGVHDFHPIILDEILHASARSKVEQYDSYLFLSYHFPLYDQHARTSRRAEIDFLITKDTVITIRYEDFEPLRLFREHLRSNDVLAEQILGNGGFVVYYILQEINDFCLRELRHIEQNVTSVTKHLFSHREYLMLQRISYIKRDILDYGVIVKPQGLLLQSLRDVGVRFWGEPLRVYLADLIGDNLKITQQLENFRETIESCEETNAQLLNAKTNAVMQRFSILAFLTFPLMLYTALFTVDAVASMFPRPEEFWIGFGIVFLITLITIYIFRKKGLLQDWGI
jgi:magnesium transporter